MRTEVRNQPNQHVPVTVPVHGPYQSTCHTRLVRRNVVQPLGQVQVAVLCSQPKRPVPVRVQTDTAQIKQHFCCGQVSVGTRRLKCHVVCVVDVNGRPRLPRLIQQPLYKLRPTQTAQFLYKHQPPSFYPARFRAAPHVIIPPHLGCPTLATVQACLFETRSHWGWV